VIEAIAAHVGALAVPGVRVEVRADQARVPAYTIPAGHPAIRAATAALEAVYPGEQVLLTCIPGTLPATDLFERVLGAKTLFFSFSTPTRSCMPQRVHPHPQAAGGDAGMGAAVASTSPPGRTASLQPVPPAAMPSSPATPTSSPSPSRPSSPNPQSSPKSPHQPQPRPRPQPQPPHQHQ